MITAIQEPDISAFRGIKPGIHGRIDTVIAGRQDARVYRACHGRWLGGHNQPFDFRHSADCLQAVTGYAKVGTTRIISNRDDRQQRLGISRHYR
ncbi:MAG: hypothetical protein CL558_08315 [Alphaproteobacteria bacterium]|nr:hypothetical protein [Alphaproteobacteria bacterium]MBN53569.1 hypothetical protein [Alphaproteobacteria bacterium]OUT41556.1 MAG: hypothetical protein CBB62_04275 [Micavibrio sp. TMED2]